MNPLILSTLLGIGGGGAGKSGFNPLSLLLNLGLGSIGGLFGGTQARREKAFRQQLMQLMQPSALTGRTNQFYNQFLNSPAYTSAQRGAFNAGNELQQNLASSLAQRGLTTSGIGSVAPALAGSAASGMLGQARTGAYNLAASQAEDSLRQQIENMMRMGTPGASSGSELFGAGLGGGLEDYIKGWLSRIGTSTPGQSPTPNAR